MIESEIQIYSSYPQKFWFQDPFTFLKTTGKHQRTFKWALLSIFKVLETKTEKLFNV